MNSNTPPRTGWTRWQIVTLATLTLGYTGYYLCRSNYSVSKPKILEEFKDRGLDKAALGVVDSAGTLCYAVGKIIAGVAADFVSARYMFVGAMFASILATIAFAFSSGKGGFIAAWSVNRTVQSAGWVSLTKISAQWFGQVQYGRAMAILALSYFFGDALARLLYGELFAHNITWQQLYFIAAGLFTVIAVVCLVLLRNDPQAAGEPPVAGSEKSVFEKSGEQAKPEGIAALLRPLFASPAFWLVCVMSFGLTLTRETFNSWTPTYFTEQIGLSTADAARYSSLFPFFGGVSVLAAGWASDTVFKGQRGVVMVVMLVPVAICLWGLTTIDAKSQHWLPLALVSATALCMGGPYAFLSGAISLDLGSKKGSATAAGFIDSVGYSAGVLAGQPVAKLAQDHGWGRAFGTLAVIAVSVAVAAYLYWRLEVRRVKASRLNASET